MQSHPDSRWITTTCFTNCGGSQCLLQVELRNGEIQRIKSDDVGEDSMACPQVRACGRGYSLKQQLYSRARVRYPMKRKHWQPGGGRKELRGRDEWVRMSWDEALDLVAGEFLRIREEHGNEAILELGGHLSGLINAFGGAARSWGSQSLGTWQATGPMVGLSSGGPSSHNDRTDVENCELIVMWGSNPTWSSHGNAMCHYLSAKRKGTRFVFVDPYFNDSAMVLADQWIPVRPGTDHALALGMAHVLLSEDDPETNPLIDWDFLDRCTVGFDREHMPPGADADESFRDYLLGAADGLPKSPEWASRICGVPVPVIRDITYRIAKTRKTGLVTAWAPARTHNADSWPQMFMTLGCMTGHLGESGRMTAVSAHGGAGSGGGALWGPGDLGGSHGPGNPLRIAINHSELWDAVLEGWYTSGPDEQRPIDIQAIVHAGGSALNQRPGLVKGIQAHRKVEFVLTQNIVLDTCAAYSDVVLPVTMGWERAGGLSGSREHIVWSEPVLDPPSEARDDAWIAENLAKRLGLPAEPPPSPSRAQQVYKPIAGAWILTEDGETREPLFTITSEDLDDLGVAGPPQSGRLSFREFRQKGIHRIPRARGDAHTYIAFEEFRRDPAAHPLGTETGKFEIHCQRLSTLVGEKGFSTVRSIPAYRRAMEGYEDAFSDWDRGTRGPFPLQLVTPHDIARTHSTLDDIDWLREQYGHCLLTNALDAEERGLSEGDVVIVSSRHGRVLRPVHITNRVMPGVVLLGEGVWPDFAAGDEIDTAGSTNVLNGAVPTGQGHVGWNTCNVEVARYDGPLALSRSKPVDLERGVRPQWAPPSALAEVPEAARPRRRQLGFFFDSAACTGCKTCVFACKAKDDSPVGVSRRWVAFFEEGSWERPAGPDGTPTPQGLTAYALSLSCLHCEEPRCREACPEGAVLKREDGIVLIDQSKCTGCSQCEEGCPYGLISLDARTKTASKCDLCVDLLDQNEAPACVAACPMRALDVGWLDDLETRHSCEQRRGVLPNAELTRPAILLALRDR